MGYDTGFSGQWGYVLNNVLPPALMEKLETIIYEDSIARDEEEVEDRLEAMLPEVFDFFERIGIILPPNSWIHYQYIGEYPGNRFLPEEFFSVGIGIYLPPWNWPPVDESFKRTAELVGYVWGG